MNSARQEALMNLRQQAEKKHLDDNCKKIIGFWHICMINNYWEIITEQLNLILSSDLYEQCSDIFVGCSGDKNCLIKTEELFKPYPKIKINAHFNITDYEFPTLKIIKNKADTEDNFIAFYIHTKAVSFPNIEGGKHWRDYMNHYIITRWQNMFTKLKEGYDTCGVKLIQKGVHPMHYSGNFWWAKSKYLKTLPSVDSLNKRDRFQAEMWLCKNNPFAFNMCDKFVDYNTKGEFIK